MQNIDLAPILSYGDPGLFLYKPEQIRNLAFTILIVNEETRLHKNFWSAHSDKFALELLTQQLQADVEQHVVQNVLCQ